MMSQAETATASVTVGIDGSGRDRTAVAWGVRTARAYRVPVRLVHAFTHDDAHVGERLRAAEDLARTLDPEVIVRPIAAAGSPVDVLLEQSTKSLVVVLAPLAGEPLEAMGWSTSPLVAATAGCPVVSLARAFPDGGPVVVGVDGSSISEAALAFAFAHAAAVGAAVVAVHSWQDSAEQPPASGGIGLEPVLEAEERVLAERLAGWQERYPQVAVRRVVAHGRAADALAEHAASAQLLVVGTSGRAGLSGLLHGSTSQALLYQPPCPLAIVGNDAGADG
jgi:nucleotide-binding universal stress UspA family protein